MIRPVRPDGRIETGGAFKPIPRPRVVERIANAAEHRVVVIAAPAGYGKSVALSQFLQELDEPWTRFDLRPEHDTLPGFLRGLSESFEEVAPEARRTFPGAYERNRSSTTAGADLAIWMHAHLKAYRGTIAIDDLHVAEKDPEVVRFLVALIERTKGHIRWIISSRTVEGLPVGTWLAYNDCDLTIDERDLRFSTEEAKEAASAFRLGVREDELRSLIDLTDGWPTALSFALRTSTRSVDLRSVTMMTREMIYNYLADQVYRSLSDEERGFLEATALLSEIDSEAMIAIGFDRAQKLIADLRERVAFLHEVRPGVYRCHDLFRDFVLYQLELEGATAKNRLRCTIASALETIGRVRVALRLYADAGAEGSVLRLTEEHGFDLLATGYTDLVLTAIAAMTEEHRREHPVVLALRGALEVSIGRFEEAEPLMRRSMELTGDPALRAGVAMRLALININLGKGMDAETLLDRMVDGESIPQALLAEALALRAVIAARAGEKEKAAALLDRIDEETAFAIEDASLARTRQRQGVVAWELREDQRARFALSQSADIANRLSMHSLACRALGMLVMEAAYCENDVALAIWYGQQAANAAGKSGDVFDMHAEALRLLGLEVWRGNAERVVALGHRAGELRSGDASRGIYIVESHAYQHAWEGRFAEACSVFAGIVDRQATVIDTIVTRAVYALCLALDGQSKASKSEIAVVLDMTDAEEPAWNGFGSLLLESAQLLTALAEGVAGRHAGAKRILKREPISNRPAAVAMREAVGCLCRNTGLGALIPDVSYWLARMEQHGLGGFARLVDRGREALEQAALGQVHLTDSEVRIVTLLAAGLTRKQIAVETGRSLLTVQTHIKHAIAKLGCKGQAELAGAAERMGLLA
ncbi:MAG TPA: LuxR C-terminal-related transcriptional regulator [Candidatus Tyrphobacter sp.]